MQSYTGDYLLDGDTLTFIKKGNEFVFVVSPGETYRIYFSSPEDFFAKEIRIEFKFEKDAAGKVKDFYFKQGGRELRAIKIK